MELFCPNSLTFYSKLRNSFMNPYETEIADQLSVATSIIDAHGLKLQGRGYLNFFPKSLGGQGFQEKCHGGPPISGFIAF